MPEKSVLVVSANGDDPTTGYATRVLAITDTLIEAGFRVNLLRFYPFHVKRSWRSPLAGTRVNLIEIPVLPLSRYPLARWLTIIIANIITHLMAKILRCTTIQAESHDAALVALCIDWKSCPVLVDIHGAAPEEGELIDQLNNRVSNKAWLHHAEKVFLKKAHTCFVVSNSMSSHLHRKHKNIATQFQTLPIGVNESHFPEIDHQHCREALNIPANKIVLAYCGGDQAYQCLDEMAKVIALAESHLPIHVLVISKSKNKFTHAFKNLHSEITFVSANHKDIYKYLCAADFGLLIRQNDIINAVSCPTKLAEYLICGLGIITTPWAGHGPEIVEKFNAGVVLDPNTIDADALISALSTKPDRAALRRQAIQHLSWNAVRNRLTQSHTQASRL
jgi:glycosyltransferase involved in cell wall biosynthesis